MIVETTIRGEIFTYRVLWDCCLAQLQTAKRRKTQAQSFYISAMLMAYLTYEAYINFLGDRFAPDIWVQERKIFNGKEYRGIQGKLKYLSERIPINGIIDGKRPMQSIQKLKKLRDFLSHGRIDKYETTIKHKRDNDPPLFGQYGKIDKLVTPELAEITIMDVKSFMEFLHSQARNHTEDMWFGEDPWDAFIAHAMSDSKMLA
jgi:hypothetical protein